MSEKELIRLAGSIEEKSTHPIGKAFLKYMQENKILKADVKNVNNFFITSISLIFISTIIMLLSTFIKNRSITSGISILLLTFGITITELLLSKDINIVKYTFLPYIDLNYYNNNLIDTINQLYDINLSLKLGIPILLCYSTLFTIIGIRIFKKKDI